MKKFFVFVILLLTLAACNNGDKKMGTGVLGTDDTTNVSVDTLMAAVMDGHNIGMAKMSKLSIMQNKVQAELDSVARLPAKALAAAEPYKRELNGLLEDLKSAKDGMEKWMDEFNMDSAVNNLKARINYLGEEKLKVSKVKEAILSTLQKADSVLKSRL